MDFKPDNFDNEFKMNKKTKKNGSVRKAKVPSWLLILAGVAVIGGVVAAKQPAVRTVDNTGRNSMVLPASQQITGDPAVISGVNDEQADPSELEARFASQTNAQYVVPAEGDDPEVELISVNPTSAIIISSDQMVEADEIPFGDAPAEKSAENPAVVRLNDGYYSVSVVPAEQSTASETGAVQSMEFTADGQQYVLSLTKLDEDEAPSDPSPVVWLNETPVQVSVNASGDNAPVEVSLNPLPEEETVRLQQERFGPSYGQSAETQPSVTEVPEATEAPADNRQNSNWFARLFNEIFGNTPTVVPTPQVTVIAFTPTPTTVQPTATPIVIQMQPTAVVQQNPVRLDDPEAKGLNGQSSDLNDPALWDDGSATATVPPVQDQPSESTPEPTRKSPVKIDVVVVDSLDDPAQTPSVQPTSEELPHTGGAESWNIPSLLAMLAGLLLVIIGVRRLRSK